MKWVLICLWSIVVCVATENYKCNQEKKCQGSDQCCNVKSFFNLCCPKQSTCCANGPKVKCCGPLDVCCNTDQYSSVACCPKNYRCCASGRYGGLRNTCCYKVPAWLWIIMGLSLSLILLMLLLSLVECFVEERGRSSGEQSYDNAYNSHPAYPASDYGTYPSYNSNDLYNEPRYGVVPASRTPPPRYSADTPPEERAAAQQQAPAGTTRGGAEAGSPSGSLPDNTQLQEEGDIVSQIEFTAEVPSTAAEEEPLSSTAAESSGNLTLDNTWDSYLKKRLMKRRSESNSFSISVGQGTSNSISSSEQDFLCSPSQTTLDSGIVDCVSSDSDSSFHCSSWEDEEDIRHGQQIVYELNSKGISRMPRLETLLRKNNREKSDRRTAVQLSSNDKLDSDTTNETENSKQMTHSPSQK